MTARKRKPPAGGDPLVPATSDAEIFGATGVAPVEANVSGTGVAVDAESKAVAEPAEHFDDPHDGAHVSISARLLRILGIFLVGIVAALWAGPKIAPNLPSGLGFVADWLTPGKDAALIAVEAARSELSARIATIPAAPSVAELTALVDESIAARLAELETRIDDLVDRQGLPEAEFAVRLEALEARIAALDAEMTTLVASAGSVAAPTGTAPDMAQVAGLTAQINAIRAGLASIAGKHAALAQEVTSLRAKTESRIAAAQTEVATAEAQAEATRASAEIQVALAALSSAVDSGLPFGKPLARLAELTGAESPAALLVAAETGVATIIALQESFPQAAHEAIRAATQAAAGDGMLAGIGAFLEAQIAARSLSPQTGTGTDAVLSRAEEGLRHGNLDLVFLELAALPAEAAASMAGWQALAGARTAALQALADLSAAYPAPRPLE